MFNFDPVASEFFHDMPAVLDVYCKDDRFSATGIFQPVFENITDEFRLIDALG